MISMNIFDLHTHSVFSDGTLNVEQLIDAYQKNGYTLGISDHIFCSKLDNTEKIRRYLDYLKRFHVLRGVEANIGEDYSLPDDIDRDIDYVIASVHTAYSERENINLGRYFGIRAGHIFGDTRKFSEDESKYFLENILKNAEKTFKTQRSDIYGHPTVLPFCEVLKGHRFLSDWENEIIALCIKYNKAIEISGMWRQPEEQFIRKAKKAGAKFSFASDCHRAGEECNLSYPMQMFIKCGLGEKDIFVPKKPI